MPHFTCCKYNIAPDAPLYLLQIQYSPQMPHFTCCTYNIAPDAPLYLLYLQYYPRCPTLPVAVTMLPQMPHFTCCTYNIAPDAPLYLLYLQYCSRHPTLPVVLTILPQMPHFTCCGDDVAPDSPSLEHAEEDPKEPGNQNLRASPLHFGDIGSHLRQVGAFCRPHRGRRQSCKLNPIRHDGQRNINNF